MKLLQKYVKPIIVLSETYPYVLCIMGNISQTTNFGLYQNKRVCRQQF